MADEPKADDGGEAEQGGGDQGRQPVPQGPARRGGVQRALALQRGRRDGPQVPRELSAGRPRPPDPPEARGEGEGVLDDGPDPDAGRQMHPRAIPGRRRAGQDHRQRHDPDHDPAGIPAPRRPQVRPPDHDPHGSTRSCSRPSPPAATSSGTSSPAPLPIRDGVRDAMQRDADAFVLALRPAGDRATTTSGSTARRSRTPSCPSPARSRSPPPATTRSSRSTARPTSPGSSRPPSPCPRTIAPTSWPMTSAFWPSSRTGRNLVGYNVLVGGGLGTTPSAEKTFPALGSSPWPMSIGPRSSAVGEAVMKVYRDFGNRSDRKRARIKYLVHDWGMPRSSARRSRSTSAAPGRPEAGRGHGRRRPPRLARAGGRQAVPRPAGRERPDQGRGGFPAPGLPQGVLREVPDPVPDDLPAVDPPGRPRPERGRPEIEALCWRRTGSRRSSGIRPSGAGRWPARRCRPAAWP